MRVDRTAPRPPSSPSPRRLVGPLLLALAVALAGVTGCAAHDSGTSGGTSGGRTRGDAGGRDALGDAAGGDGALGGDGASSGDGGPGPGGGASMSGTVWAPGNAPGMVPEGWEIPVFGAVVYLSRTRPDPIPGRAYCEGCETLPEGAVFTDAEGAFVIDGVVPDDYWLVIQKGQFRLEQAVSLEAGQTLVLDADATTLPSNHDPESGRWVPHIAIALGEYDHLEDIFGKMGMGTVDEFGEMVTEEVPDLIDLWDNGGAASDVAVEGTLTELVSSLDRLLDYHIVFVPCAGNFNVDALSRQDVLQNLRDYVALGGKLYVTDWSGEWMDDVFPTEITLAGDGVDTPASAWDAADGTWDPSQFGTANGQPYDSHNGEAVDEDLATWLDGQSGPTPFGDPGVFDASRFDIQGAWNVIEAVTPVELGTAEDGSPIIDEPRVYVVAGTDVEPEPKGPMTVTFEPVGCGRVLYSTYHTTDVAHPGLTPQERILLFLIMEIGVCKEGKEFFE